MDRLLDKARSSQNALERLVNMIPGFSGYREKDLRRTADGLQREHLARRLEETKKPLNDLSLAKSREGLGAMNEIETARKRLDKVIARIRFAERGYSGFFDAVKVDENLLAKAYEFDLGLLQDVEAISQAAGEARKTSATQPLISAIDALDTRLGEREALLRGVQ